MCLILLPVPAALACDAALKEAVAARAEDTDARYALARSCARAGEPQAALAQYDQLLLRDPANVDWLLGRSQALVALGRPREALPALETARRSAPRYEDVWRVNATALEALGDDQAADALLAQAAAQFPESAWPRERRRALQERRLRESGTRAIADLSYESLSGDRPAWKGASLGIDHRLAGDRRAFAGLHLEERFDTRDEQLLLRFAGRLGTDWSYGFAADAARDAEILPEWSFAADAGRALAGGWGLGLRFRHAAYLAADVDTVSIAADRYFGAYSAGYSLNAAKTSGIDDPSFGHVLRFAREYGDASRAALVVGFGEEAETVAPGVVRVTDTRSISISGLHWTSAAWGIAWEAGWYEQGDLYDRLRVRLGLEHRF